ncbi:hypothetical protein [Mangrovibacterium diazotrophicum]|uniref:Uncharacterized protein n=1 Tax=Mangrovibacterium diazotrophicum TaxID=1261403 RepID=A0A419WAP2_9BACT|nr:hypothetical protein [Mangrovibacterium diazotrophicum]RKD92527.1 hypothetical protein BC643_2901 [Mangrovibacterium diazotrophicum]
MYFALKQDKNSSEAYLNFLEDIIDRGNKEYAIIFSQIVDQAQRLAKTGDFYSVDSDRFGIVSYFSRFKGVIDGMDYKALQINDYRKLKSCLEQEAIC